MKVGFIGAGKVGFPWENISRPMVEMIPLPLILTGLALILGVTAEISALHGRLLPASLIASILPSASPAICLSGSRCCSTLWVRCGSVYSTGGGSGCGGNSRCADR